MVRTKKTIRKAKESVINVRCTSEQKAALEVVAAGEGVGLSTWVLQAALIKAEAKR